MPLAGPNPDDGLVPDQLPRLNEAFYATRPWDYFNHRNHLLMLAAGAGEQLLDIAKQGVVYKGLRYQEKDDDEELDAKAREEFVMTDSEALLHHASETLLRLYLAHEGLPPCPWLAMARIRNFTQFKKMVEKRFTSDMSTEELRDLVGPVFFGSKNRTDLKPSPSVEVWETGLDNIEAFLGHYARHFLESEGYNAFKHGLGVRPGEQMTQLAPNDPDNNFMIGADGPAIEYLTVRRNSEGLPRWNQTVRWVRPEHSMGTVFIASSLMESLWTIAKGRYVREKVESLNLWNQPLCGEVTSQLKDGESAAVIVETMNMELTYYEPPGPGDSKQHSPPGR